MFRKKGPPNDDAYFENMCRVIFQAGLNWNVIEKKWPDFREAFHHFSIENVATTTLT
jgi:3-methyladenine DNA glycosylase Tag